MEMLVRKFKAYLGLALTSISEEDRRIWNGAPDLRDDQEESECPWIEAGKVEEYLMDLGVDLAGTDPGVAFVKVSSRTRSERSRSASTPGVPGDSQMAPQVSYGSTHEAQSNITDSHFRIPDSWLNTTSSSPAGESSHIGSESVSICYLDVNRFFSGLIHICVCLGRAAGFRKREVDVLLGKCLVSL